jgi:hypothetical protein
MAVAVAEAMAVAVAIAVAMAVAVAGAVAVAVAVRIAGVTVRGGTQILALLPTALVHEPVEEDQRRARLPPADA